MKESVIVCGHASGRSGQIQVVVVVFVRTSDLFVELLTLVHYLSEVVNAVIDIGTVFAYRFHFVYGQTLGSQLNGLIGLSIGLCIVRAGNLYESLFI